MASQGAPDSGREILSALATALPVLKPIVDRALASISPISVPDVVRAAESAVASAAQSTGTSPAQLLTSSGPQIQLTPTPGAPFTSPSGSPTEVTRSQTSEVPPGGRSAPAP